MTSRIAALLLGLVALSGAAPAEVPAVVTDLPPTHSLVAQVMAGVGEPALLAAVAGSPHGRALRPSEAARLQAADVVVWVGAELSPWLDRAIDALAPGAASLELLSAPGSLRLERREDAAFAADQDGHDHGAIDPHAWLDPENARAWLAAIAETLAEADPENADRYRRNAEAAQAGLAAVESRAAQTLAPVSEMPFLVGHDAFRYFEERFGLAAVGAVSASDDSAPGPARLREVEALVRDSGAACILAEPGFDPRLAAVVAGAGALPVVTADPVGATLPPGPELYARLIEMLAAAVLACRGPA